ncbi:MAG: outer membrane beta-barrel protein [Prevotella sp.]|nr:outer membrane beta-barrel protein [Prevotella sp.]
MKKIFMTLVIAAMAVSANAQLYVGGGVAYGTEKLDTDGAESVASWKFVPEIGYNFTDDMAAGIAFGWEGSNKGGQKSFEINPYFRYTFLKEGMVSLFADASVGYKHYYSNPTANINGVDTKVEEYNVLSAGIKPGVAFNVTEKFSVVAHVGFFGWQQDKCKYLGQTTKKNAYRANLDGNDIVLSLYYNF